MNPVSSWTRHVDGATRKVYCWSEVEQKSVWGDPTDAWEGCPGGGWANTVTEEVCNAEGTEARWYGEWYPCTVRRVKADGVVDVMWEDGTGTGDVPPQDVRNDNLREQAGRGGLWNVHVCWDTKKVFYVQALTGASTWTEPIEHEVWTRTMRSWKQHKSEYYYNTVTGEVTPSMPAEWFCLVDEPALAYWYGGWYPCTVWRRCLDGLCDVRWPDGTGTRSLTPSSLRPLPVTFPSPHESVAIHFEALGVTRVLPKPHVRPSELPSLKLD